MAWYHHTSLTNFIIQQSRSSKAYAFRFVSRTVCSPCRLSIYTATKPFQSQLYGSGTVFRNISHLLRHFPSSSCSRLKKYFFELLPVITVVVPAKWHCHFMDTLIAFTYLCAKNWTILRDGQTHTPAEPVRDALHNSRPYRTASSNRRRLNNSFLPRNAYA